MQSDIIVPPRGEEKTQPPPQKPLQTSSFASNSSPAVGNEVSPSNQDLHLGIGLRSPKEDSATATTPKESSEHDNQSYHQAPEITEQVKENPKNKSRRTPALIIALAILIFICLAGLAIYRELGPEETTFLMKNLV